MATIANPNEEQNNPNQQPTTGGTSSVGAAGSSVAPQAKSPVAQNQGQGAGYTDVASYLNANPQGGQNLGNQVAQNLTNQYNTTKQGIDTSVNAANTAVNQGYTPENTQLISQVAANPTAAANDQHQLGAFQTQLNDVYGGPTSYEDLGTQQGNVAQAVQYGGLVNTPGGNNELIQQVENQTNPGQSGTGINTLDTLLYQGNPNAVQTATTAAAPFSTLNDYLTNAATGVQSNITAAQANAAKASQDALNAFTGTGGTLTNLNQNINQTAATDLANEQAKQAALNTDIANLYGGVAANTAPATITGYGGTQNPWYNTTNYTVGQLSPQDLATLGITQDQWNSLQAAMQKAGTSTFAAGHNFGANSPTSQIDISQFLNQQNPNTAITPTTTATPEQYAEMAAIQKLLGSQTPQGMTINPLNVSQAGTFNPQNLNTFDYNAALKQAQDTAQAEQTAAQQEAQGLTSAADLAHAESQHGGGFGGFLKNVVNHPLNNPVTQFFENPITSVGNLTNPAGTKKETDLINNLLAKYGPAAVGTNI